MSFEKAAQKNTDTEVWDARLRYRMAKTRYSEAASKLAKIRIACDYPGAPDYCLATYARAKKEFKTESQIHYAAQAEFVRVMRNAGVGKEPEFSVEELIQMQDRTNARQLEQDIRAQQVLENTKPEFLNEAMETARMDSETRQRFIDSGKTLTEFRASEPALTLKEQFKEPEFKDDPTFGDFEPL